MSVNPSVLPTMYPNVANSCQIEALKTLNMRYKGIAVHRCNAGNLSTQSDEVQSTVEFIKYPQMDDNLLPFHPSSLLGSLVERDGTM